MAKKRKPTGVFDGKLKDPAEKVAKTLRGSDKGLNIGEIVADINSNGANSEVVKRMLMGQPLDQNEMAALQQVFGGIDTEDLSGDMTEERQLARAFSLYGLAQQNNENARAQLDAMRRDIIGSMGPGIKGQNIAGALVRGFDVGTGLSQQRQANESLAGQRMPMEPSSIQRDPMLAQRIRQASVQNLSPLSMPEVTAMRGGIGDAYRADIMASRAASGGQAGRFGSMGQAAVNRRYRNEMAIPGAMMEARRRNAAELDSLLGARQRETSMINADQRNAFNTRLRQYNLGQQAAGQLGSAGRTNVRRGLGGIAQNIGEIYDWENYFNSQLI